jgi:hypothetical protein
MKMRRNLYSKDFINILLLFCYIFSFHVVGLIDSALIVAVPLFFIYILSSPYKKKFKQVLSNYFIVRVFLFQFILIGVGAFYCICHFTFDYSYIKILFSQQIHAFSGIFIITYLTYKQKIDPLKIENYFIYIFLFQSFIQIIASIIPEVAFSVRYFNQSDDFQEKTNGVRGLALSSGAGWSLSLSYGLVYIVYIKRFLLKEIKVKFLLIGLLLIVGILFSGRTGFIGVGIGILFLLFSSKKGILSISISLFKSCVLIFLICVFCFFLFPFYSEYMLNDVFPFAFEAFYNWFEYGIFSTRSTDQLSETWEASISASNFLWGTGYFTDPIDNAFYKHIDAGILRNLFYWGIFGYILLIIYQLFLISPIKSTKSVFSKMLNLYWMAIAIYLCMAEYKAITLGLNRIVFSIIFILSYFYFNELDSKSFNRKIN